MFLYSTQFWLFKHWQRPDSLLRHCCFKHKRQEIQQQQLLQAEIIRSGLCYAVHRPGFCSTVSGPLKATARNSLPSQYSVEVLKAGFKATIYSFILKFGVTLSQQGDSNIKGRFLRLRIGRRGTVTHRLNKIYM